LRKIGRILHISPSQKAVIKTSRPLRIGERVFDGDKRFIGKVFDVFGPINSPYVEVDLQNNREPSNLVGKMVYQLPSRRKNRSRKKK